MIAHDSFLDIVLDSLELDPEFYSGKDEFIRLVQMQLPASLTDAYKSEKIKSSFSIELLTQMDMESSEEFKEEIDYILKSLEIHSPWPTEIPDLISLLRIKSQDVFFKNFGVS